MDLLSGSPPEFYFPLRSCLNLPFWRICVWLGNVFPSLQNLPFSEFGKSGITNQTFSKSHLSMLHILEERTHLHFSWSQLLSDAYKYLQWYKYICLHHSPLVTFLTYARPFYSTKIECNAITCMRQSGKRHKVIDKPPKMNGSTLLE